MRPIVIGGDSRTTLEEITQRFRVLYANRLPPDERPTIEMVHRELLKIAFPSDPHILNFKRRDALEFLHWLEEGNHGTYRSFRSPKPQAIGMKIDVNQLLAANERMRIALERIRTIGYQAAVKNNDNARDSMTTIAGEAMWQ